MGAFKLYLLSPMEIWGNNSFSEYNSSNTYWWLRTGNSDMSYTFRYVDFTFFRY